MVTAMICYIPVAHLADKYGRRPFVLATFLFFTLFPVTLLWATSFGWLALAFVVRGLKEFGEPARQSVDHRRGCPGAARAHLWRVLLDSDCVVTSGSFLGPGCGASVPARISSGRGVRGYGTAWFWWFVYRRTPATGLTRGPECAESARVRAMDNSQQDYHYCECC